MAFFSFCMVFFSVSEVKADYYNLSWYDEERDLLRSEMKLAGGPDLYLIFGLDEMKMYLKARGMILKEIDIAGMRFWGDRLSIKPHMLVRKASLFSPRREKIIPGNSTQKKKDSDVFRIEALELDDMPGNYRLVFDENITLHVHSASGGITGKIFGIGSLIYWHVYIPVETIWHKIRKKKFTAVRLTMSEEDARSLYWSVMEGINLIMYKQRIL